MNILILYLIATGELKTLYDIDGKYDHVEVGTFLQEDENTGWVLDLPGSVQEGDRMLREEREWLLSEGREYAQSRGMAVIVYDPQTDGLTTVLDCEQQYCVKLGTAVNGTYAVSQWHDCTADTIPTFMQVAQLDDPHREFFLKQGRAYAQAETTSVTMVEVIS